jgi:hypothetical protein
MTDYPVIMLILPLAVGNKSIAYKITDYKFYSSNARRWHARCNFKQVQGKAASFTQQKKANIFYTSFLFDVLQHFYTPNIIILL